MQLHVCVSCADLAGSIECPPLVDEAHATGSVQPAAGIGAAGARSHLIDSLSDNN